MDKALEKDPVKPEPLLVKALNQSEQVKNKVEECAQELSQVNTVAERGTCRTLIVGRNPGCVNSE